MAALVGVLFVCTLPAKSYGETASIHTGGAENPPTLQLDIHELERAGPSISLVQLIQGLGGTTTRTPSRMRIDLNNTTAWVGLNDNRVNALSIFTLSKNIVATEDDVFIAIADCESFFTKAFRMNVAVGTGNTAPQSGGTLRERLNREDRVETMSDTPVDDTTPAFLEPDLPPPVATKIRNVLISPGHGGFDDGVRSSTGTLEKEITLNIALQIRDLLSEDESLNVELMREEDVSLSHQQRNAIVRAKTPDLLLTLHLGGSFSEQTRGAAAFYTNSTAQSSSTSVFRRRDYNTAMASISAGETLLETLRSDLDIPTRGVHPIPNELLDSAECPSLLIELGCLTNSEDEQKLTDPGHQLALAESIIRGIRAINTKQSEPAAVPELNNDSVPSDQ